MIREVKSPGSDNMGGMRTRKSVTCAAVLAVLGLAPGIGAAPVWAQEIEAGPAVTSCGVVDIHEAGLARVDAIRATPGLLGWIELDRELFVCGPVEVLNGLTRTAGVLRRWGAVNVGRLRIAYGLTREELGRAGATVLASGGRAAVVDVGQGGDLLEPPLWRGGFFPLEFGEVMARQAANDRVPPGARDVSRVAGLIDAVDINRWFGAVDTLDDYNRYTHVATGSAIGDILDARDWLVARFQELPGFAVTTQSFIVPSSGPDTTAYNVLATLPGSAHPDDWFIVGGHYDSTSQSPSTLAPGAEDNASGCAGVLEMARVFAVYRPSVTMIFACYAGEEQGLWGSSDHAARLVAAGDDGKVKAVLNMDMIGYTGDADLDCLLESNSTHQSVLNAFSAAAASHTSLRIVTSLNPWGSDHVPYLNRGMPAVLTIENDYGSYAHYHRTTDTADKLVLDMAHEILKMNVVTMADLMGTLFVDGFEAGDLVAWGGAINE